MASPVRVIGIQDLRNHKAGTSRREKIARFLISARKFAMDSLLTESLKGVNGVKKVYKIVEEQILNRFPSSPQDCQKHDFSFAEAEMEEVHEISYLLKQQNKTSVELARNSERSTKKMSNGGLKGSDQLQSNEKRVFIRSRL